MKSFNFGDTVFKDGSLHFIIISRVGLSTIVCHRDIFMLIVVRDKGIHLVLFYSWLRWRSC